MREENTPPQKVVRWFPCQGLYSRQQLLVYPHTSKLPCTGHSLYTLPHTHVATISHGLVCRSQFSLLPQPHAPPMASPFALLARPCSLVSLPRSRTNSPARACWGSTYIRARVRLRKVTRAVVTHTYRIFFNHVRLSAFLVEVGDTSKGGGGGGGGGGRNNGWLDIE